uniref:Integrase catalytic domain-containing protein n=1 Tax=Fagus sylvatica TaxID=28930 RepID=A0A2N9EGE1_FAGSY
MTVYLDHVKEIRDKLGSVGVNVDDEDLLHVVLKGLPPEYDPFCSAMRTRDRVISCEELHVLLTSEEESKKNATHMKGVVDKVLTEVVVDEVHLALIVVVTPLILKGFHNPTTLLARSLLARLMARLSALNVKYVTVGNGQSLPIKHSGNSQLYASSHLFKLRHILHVPSMSSNLLSVYRFCKDNNASFSFDAHNFQIKDLNSGKLLYNGLSEHGFYPIHGAILPKSSSPKSFHTFATDASSNLWPQSFGASTTNSGKMHQLPFPKSVSITSRPLEIVHSDVWGPAPITSTNGTRYYITFVDDFTRFTWFFPLHHKCQVLSSFMHFKSTMENLLSCKLKILRTDCGGEYSKHEFQSFCSSTGVLHQFTCPHISQQNGVAERKHRHIVDMGLTLMSQASLPLTFWPYAFSTSVFLINRLPSPQ